jgi:hypothetical protein
MLLDYYSRNGSPGEGLEFEIDAFDINAGAVEAAKKGSYTSNTLRTDGTEWKFILDSYLIPRGNGYEIAPGIREKVRFFSHNIMRGFEKNYDLIFFRNALIYFSSKNRLMVMDAIAESLFPGGLLFLGVSETSSVRHPLLENRCLSEVFYFQKASSSGAGGFFSPKLAAPSFSPRGAAPEAPPPEAPPVRAAPKAPSPAAPPERRRAGSGIDPAEVAGILEKAEGRPNAEQVSAALDSPEKEGEDPPPGSALAAAAVFFLNAENFEAASRVLSRLEMRHSGALTSFLRGEYHFHRNDAGEARKCYEESAGKDKAFWPAFYRLSSLAAGDNRTRYGYKLKKALESLELGGKLHYECFLGGFSPDYFHRILEKKTAENDREP